ncbi:MAG: hypothetical protein SPJ23_09475 [Eubacteriales bacterium]|nr:hypothetical protein [Eubacteriales bacterium]
MTRKRVTLFCGHYGSGKTNIAINYALALSRTEPRMAIADLDIVNPYFRTKDSAQELREAKIRLICSEYANTNLDIPALPQDLYAITDDPGLCAVVDVGGDDRGALALGRIAPALAKENNYEMLMVLNAYRPLTPDAASVLEVLREIEEAGHLRFTGLVNNSNLGRETTAETVLKTAAFAADCVSLTGLPLVMTTAEESVAAALRGKVENLFPLKLQKKIL